MAGRWMDNYADATSKAIGLPIPAEFRAAVIANLEMIFAQSAGLMALSLDPKEEVASIFQP